MQFDQYQKKVIDAQGGHFLVLAPPGCGKTELLTHRVINAHGAGLPYEKMLCLTTVRPGGCASVSTPRQGTPVRDSS